MIAALASAAAMLAGAVAGGGGAGGLVVTGAEEREVTGSPTTWVRGRARDVRRRDRAEDLRFALAVDEMAFGRRFTLRSPHTRARAGVGERVLTAARRRGVAVNRVVAKLLTLE